MAIWDNGADIGTPLVFHREELFGLLCMDEKTRAQFVDDLFRWVMYGSFEPSFAEGTALQMNLVQFIEKHEKRV